MGNITVKESIAVAAPPEHVWDFTQDYSRRAEWDDFVKDARVEQESPRVVWIRSHGMTCRFRYKLDDRPRKTSLLMTDIQPGWLFTGGGGAWVYENENGGTRWTNTGSLTIKNRFLYWLLKPFLAWQLRRSYRRAMTKAKAMIEAAEGVS
jgi:hypothetical protein